MMNKAFSHAPLFFRFSKTQNNCSGFPLACLNGGIMADTGSEKKDYIFYNQYRYPIYAAMGGMRSLLFINDPGQIQRYYDRLEQIKTDLDIINVRTGSFLSIKFFDPLFIPCDKTTYPYKVFRTAQFERQLKDPQILNSHAAGGIYLNQISPTIVDLLKQFYNMVPFKKNLLTVHFDAYEQMAKTALFFHDKTSYIDLMTPFINNKTFPAHIPCATICSSTIDTLNWTRMRHIFAEQTSRNDFENFYIKSNVDAAGEVSVCINKENFKEKILLLKTEIQKKNSSEKRRNMHVKLLIQPFIQRLCDDNLPSSIGITYNIIDENRYKLLSVIGQVYEDPGYQTFIGSFMSQDFTRHVLSCIGEHRIINLLGLFAQNRYRGPINLDAVRNKKGEYDFIYDCNPRLGGSFPGLMLKKTMQVQGHTINSILTLGYRGRFVYPDLGAKLDQLYRHGILYTRKNPRGICIIPSFVRQNSYDLALINMKPEKLRHLMDKDMLDSLSDKSQKDLKGVYF